MTECWPCSWFTKTSHYIAFYPQYLREGSVLCSTPAFLQIQYSCHCQSEQCITFADGQSRSPCLWIRSHRLLSEMDLLLRLGWPCVETDTGHTTRARPASWLHLNEKRSHISTVWLSEFRTVLWLLDVINN